MASATQLNHELFKHLPVAIYTCDKHGFITSFNHAAVKLWGRNPEINKDLWCGAWKAFTLTGEPINQENSPMMRALKQGVALEGEEIIVEREDGTKVNILPHLVPVFDAEGNVSGAINTLIDVTEKRISEQNQAMLASIITSSDDAIISKTLDGIITSWNIGAEFLFGYTATEAIGKNITMVIPRYRLKEEKEILGKIRKGERVEHYKTFRLHKSGVEIPVSLAISPIKDIKGKIIGASKIARNIAKQQLVENNLQRYAENLEMLNIIGKAVSEKLDVEDILQKVADATTLITGASFGAFFYNKINENGEINILYALAGTLSNTGKELSLPADTRIFNNRFMGMDILRIDDISKDDRYDLKYHFLEQTTQQHQIVSYLSIPVISKSNNNVGVLVFGHPQAGKFTKEHETLLSGVASQASIALDNAQLYEEIHTLNAKKDEFIGLASHELKTPMTSVNGYLQIISRNLADDDKNKLFIQKALSQINKLSELISDLLDVSKIEAGKLPLSFDSFNLQDLVDEVVDLMQHTTKSHRIVICSEIDELIVVADKSRLEQVIINLISNAIKYSPQANYINISVAKEQNKAIVKVKDFGIGINKEVQEHIFSRFYRVDDLALHISGLGIGLYISHEIVTRHNGKLLVDSKPGEGSEFWFEIPMEQ